MYDVSETLTSVGSAGVETFANLANTAFGGAERLVALNLNAVRTLMEDGTARTRAFLDVKDAEGLTSLSMATQPGLEKIVVYSRSVCQIAADTQEALSGVVEGQVSEFSQNAAQMLDSAAESAPPGSELALDALRSALSVANSACGSMSMAARQVSEMTEATLATVAVKKPGRKAG